MNKEFWLNIYRDDTAPCCYTGGRLFHLEEQALEAGRDHPAYVCTMKIEVPNESAN